LASLPHSNNIFLPAPLSLTFPFFHRIHFPFFLKNLARPSFFLLLAALPPLFLQPAHLLENFSTPRVGRVLPLHQVPHPVYSPSTRQRLALRNLFFKRSHPPFFFFLSFFFSIPPARYSQCALTTVYRLSFSPVTFTGVGRRVSSPACLPRFPIPAMHPSQV